MHIRVLIAKKRKQLKVRIFPLCIYFLVFLLGVHCGFGNLDSGFSSKVGMLWHWYSNIFSASLSLQWFCVHMYICYQFSYVRVWCAWWCSVGLRGSWSALSILLGRTATVEKALFTGPCFCYFTLASCSHLTDFHFTYLFFNSRVYIGVTLYFSLVLGVA